MAKLTIEYETQYDTGDVVVFSKDKELKVGLIEGYYVDNETIWYNIRLNKQFVYTYSTGGDIGERDILFKITDDECCRKFITTGEY